MSSWPRYNYNRNLGNNKTETLEVGISVVLYLKHYTKSDAIKQLGKPYDFNVSYWY
jgi:hypothetical protein